MLTPLLPITPFSPSSQIDNRRLDFSRKSQLIPTSLVASQSLSQTRTIRSGLKTFTHVFNRSTFYANSTPPHHALLPILANRQSTSRLLAQIATHSNKSCSQSVTVPNAHNSVRSQNIHARFQSIHFLC